MPDISFSIDTKEYPGQYGQEHVPEKNSETTKKSIVLDLAALIQRTNR
jgi:hypothetical protein